FSSRRRHTRFSRDWSSDVCSSDLLDHLTERDEVKFVLVDRADYEWARDVIRERGLDARVRAGTLRAILFSPVWDTLDFQDLAERSEERRVGKGCRSRVAASQDEDQ